MLLWQKLLAQQSGPAVPTSWTFTYSTLYSPAGAPSQLKLSDGDSATYWGSNSTEATGSNIFLQADFGAAVLLTSIRYRAARTADSWGTTYLDRAELQCSLDGSTWTTLTTILSSSETVTTVYTLPAPTSARYVRVRATRDPSGAFNTNTYVGLSEFHFT